MTPTGMLMAKSQGHGATDRMPAAIDGPETADKATTVALILTPLPRCRFGNTSLAMEVLTLIIIDAPRPWNAREAISIGRLCESVQNTDATVNTATPPRYTFL